MTDQATNPANPAEWVADLRETSITDAQHIIETAQAGTEPNPIDPSQIHSLVLPRGASVRIIDIEGKGATPRRKRGEVMFWDAASLSIYVNVHKNSGTSLLLDDRKPQLVAVINGDSTDAPGWGDHLAVLQFRRTEAWMRWNAINEQFIEQEAFAEHIERNLVDIVAPSGADMLELAQTFEATNSAEFRSQKRLANGQRQFTYSENIEGKGGPNGEIEIPEKITLQIAPFEGGEEYTVAARFRFRLVAGHLRLGYVLDNPTDIERQAVIDVSKQIEQTTGLPALFGAVVTGPTAAD